MPIRIAIQDHCGCGLRAPRSASRGCRPPSGALPRTASASDVSILLVEQNARAALQVADHAYVMELGEITAQGPAAQLAADPRIVESYLGLGGAA
jgi:hypothetical protein